MVEHIQTAEGFAALQPEWEALLERSDADCVFLTWDWLYTWWKHLAEGRRLSLMAVRSRGELLALLPLAVGARRLNRLAPFRSLEFLGTGSAGSDYLDVIVARGREDVALPALARHLAGQNLALDLGQVRRSATAVGLAERLRRHGWLAAERVVDVCPFIPLAGQTWSSYLASLDRQHRSNFRRRLANLTERFDMRVECPRTEKERREALSALFSLHGMRWDGRGGSTAFHSPQLRAFHHEWTQTALARDWLRLFVMRIAGRPVAALYCFRRGSVFSFYQTGFDPAFARHGVGQVLVGLSIQRAIEEGALVYDLLHGNERYKFDWARQRQELARIELYPPSLRGRLHRGLTRMERTAKVFAREVLPRRIVGRIAGTANGGTASQHCLQDSAGGQVHGDGRIPDAFIR